MNQNQVQAGENQEASNDAGFNQRNKSSDHRDHVRLSYGLIGIPIK